MLSVATWALQWQSWVVTESVRSMQKIHVICTFTEQLSDLGGRMNLNHCFGQSKTIFLFRHHALNDLQICVLVCFGRATTRHWENIRNLPTTLLMWKSLCTLSFRLQTTYCNTRSGRLRKNMMSYDYVERKCFNTPLIHS